MKRFKKFIHDGVVISNTNKINEILASHYTWFTYCKFEEADVEIQNTSIIWKNGKFYKGVIKFIIWQDGIFFNGTWENGIWEKGTWENGKWVSGIWLSGTVVNGENPNKNI